MMRMRMIEKPRMVVIPNIEREGIIVAISPHAKFYVKKKIPIKAIKMNHPFKVGTIEGVMSGKAGDWLIEGIHKELYPCDAAIFEESYEEFKDD
jgi:hypothetical protein